MRLINSQVFYPTEAIVTVATLGGSTWTPRLISITPVTEAMETEKDALPTGTSDIYNYASWDVLTMVIAVPLVYQATDTAAAETTDGGDGNDGGNGDDGEDSDDGGDDENDSAAPRTLARPAPLQLLTVIASILAGAGLLALW
ncbi:hypothetical protein G7Z17_g4754 [Cylindrodendrum hubeiense]|uniref:Uncharacterized protein n=1 Tax=Cylindrodendrum hubeiense TaxID=595255 RepID=A0A9P5L9P2_9HYPO|nr:hypothetical protein G7Z17_g4754 [Cylindrodendrum hubeiense]